MDINSRIKEIRKKLKLTQIEFGYKIGIAQGHLTQIEQGKKAVTDKTIKVICLTFNINEHWITTGQGEMFQETAEIIVADLTKKYDLDELDQQIILEYAKLSPEYKKEFKAYLSRIHAGIKNQTSEKDEISITKLPEAKPIPRIGCEEPVYNEPIEITYDDPEIEEEVESYRQELLAKKKMEASSALHHLGETEIEDRLA